jgi:hypothetical protein
MIFVLRKVSVTKGDVLYDEIERKGVGFTIFVFDLRSYFILAKICAK